DSVGVDAFLLNACQSYQQGMSLIESGSIGGIVTLTDVLNCEAVKMGRTLARLLNCGFPLRAALEVARGESIMGDHYLVVGDGSLSIAQTENGTANLFSVKRTGDSFNLKFKVYPTSDTGMGTLVVPFFEDAEYHISTGEIQGYDLSQKELRDFLSLANSPTMINGKLRWSQEIDVSDI
ncbi:MAG TPA: hypothetical protein VFJ06_06795, partial [Halococcus sp.]|nr:hypothetical protein [Halococcus sp.]